MRAFLLTQLKDDLENWIKKIKMHNDYFLVFVCNLPVEFVFRLRNRLVLLEYRHHENFVIADWLHNCDEGDIYIFC